MPVGKGSLKRAQSAASNKTAKVTEVPATQKEVIAKAGVKKVATTIIEQPIDSEIISNIHCDLPVYLL